MTSVCRLTEREKVWPSFVWAFASKQDRAEDAIRGLTKVIERERLIPKRLSTDRGRHFENSKLENFCKQNDIEQKLHVPYNPTSTGTLERFHKFLRSALAMAADETGKNWHELLDQCVAAYNDGPNASTGISPFFAVRGYHSELKFIPGNNRQNAPNPLEHGLVIAGKLDEVHHAVTLANQAADLARLNTNDEKTTEDLLEPGDRVQILREQNRQNRENNLNV